MLQLEPYQRRFSLRLRQKRANLPAGKSPPPLPRPIPAAMQIEIVTMTPDWACQILAKQNTNNRTLRPAIVRRYAIAILNDEWQLTQQGIAIDKNGVLVDGQHRLAAVVRAGKSIRTTLAMDCEPEIFKVLDTGATRKASDVLHMQGAKYRTTAAGGIKQLLQYHRQPEKVWRGTGIAHPSHAEISEFYEKNKERVDHSAAIANRNYSAFRQLNKSSVFTFLMVAMESGWQLSLLEYFMEKVSRGVDLGDDSAILKYRALLMNGNLLKNSRTVSNGGQLHLNALIKVFNLTVGEVVVRQFKAPPIAPMLKVVNAKEFAATPLLP